MSEATGDGLQLLLETSSCDLVDDLGHGLFVVLEALTLLDLPFQELLERCLAFFQQRLVDFSSFFDAHARSSAQI